MTIENYDEVYFKSTAFKTYTVRCIYKQASPETFHYGHVDTGEYTASYIAYVGEGTAYYYGVDGTGTPKGFPYNYDGNYDCSICAEYGPVGEGMAYPFYSCFVLPEDNEYNASQSVNIRNDSNGQVLISWVETAGDGSSFYYCEDLSPNGGSYFFDYRTIYYQGSYGFINFNLFAIDDSAYPTPYVDPTWCQECNDPLNHLNIYYVSGPGSDCYYGV